MAESTTEKTPVSSPSPENEKQNDRPQTSQTTESNPKKGSRPERMASFADYMVGHYRSKQTRVPRRPY